MQECHSGEYSKLIVRLSINFDSQVRDNNNIIITNFLMIDLIPCLHREFIGPITGGGLTDLLDFRGTASVSENLLQAITILL